jgi:WhiB family redox-sensing transcriptional regulator
MLELRAIDRGAFLGVICVAAFDSLVLQAKQAPGNQKVGNIVRNALRMVGFSGADELKSHEAQAVQIAIESSTGLTNGEIDESEWRRSAACKGMTNIFIGQSNEAKADKREREAVAKTVCRQCDVSNACLVDALASSDGIGVRGGLTEDERKRILRRSKIDS